MPPPAIRAYLKTVAARHARGDADMPVVLAGNVL